MSTSRSLNKVILIGNLTRNPILKTTSNNSQVCTFGIATNSVWKDAGSNVQERTEFHNIVAWNKLGEICAQLLSVGMFVYIEGELRTRTWTDDSGVRHYRTEVKAQDMKILDKKGKEGFGVDKAKDAGGDEVTETQEDTEYYNEAPEESEETAEESADQKKKEVASEEADDLF